MDKLKGWLINAVSAGLIGFIVALFEFLVLDPTKDLLRSSAIYFVFSAVIATISSYCYSWAKYKGYPTVIAYLASMLGNGISVFILLVVLLKTQVAYGWNAVGWILFITQVSGFLVAYFENRYYNNINRQLNKKKDALSGRQHE
jgi:H+/Cl- antiporter ClcA